MTRQNFTVDHSHGLASGWLAIPAGDGPWPAVVVVHEIFGLTEDIKAAANKLADQGYIAFAINLMADNRIKCTISALRGLVSGKGGPSLEAIERARVALTARDDCTGKVGIIGFCLGGGFAILAAGQGKFDVAAPAYGMVPKNVEELLQGSCPVVASYGKKDPSMRGGAAKLERALTANNIPHDVVEYPAAGHSFMTDHTGGYRWLERVPMLRPNDDAKSDSWSRVYRFFDEYLR